MMNKIIGFLCIVSVLMIVGGFFTSDWNHALGRPERYRCVASGLSCSMKKKGKKTQCQQQYRCTYTNVEYQIPDGRTYRLGHVTTHEMYPRSTVDLWYRSRNPVDAKTRMPLTWTTIAGIALLIGCIFAASKRVTSQKTPYAAR